MRRRLRRFTSKRRQAFLDNLERTGNVSAAAEAGDQSRSAMYVHRENDAELAREWDDAYHRWLDTVASIHAKRATVGEDVVIRRVLRKLNKKGEVIAEEVIEENRVYKSDRLLAQLLDRRHPEFARAVAGRKGGPPSTKPQDLGESVTEQEAASAYLALVTPPKE